MRKGISTTIILSIVLIIVIGGVTTTYIKNQNISVREKSLSSIPQLGNLCSGSEECDEYCYGNSLECEEYCRGHPKNPTCQERFAFVYEEEYKLLQKVTPQKTQGCTGKGTVSFTSPPRRLKDIEFIEPIGLMVGGHVTPIDHGYYYPPNWKPQDNPAEFKDVLSPANGTITNIQLVGGKQGDYRLVIHHTCTFYTIYIHVKELSPKIAQTIGDFSSMSKNTNIPVSAREVIGRANGFDFSVHDDETVLKGFIIPEHYDAEPWKIRTVNMFDYFVEPIKSQLLAKNVREAEPRGGKIDYDIDGRLVGNWFVENTNGYRGGGVAPDYWNTHLAFAYDGLDHSLIIVSMGNFSGEAKQFAVKGNSPDPASVSMSTGIVKYELVDVEYIIKDTGQYWDRISYAKGLKAVGIEQVHGVVLVQLIEDRKIKFETFPEKTAAEVTGFTNPTIYER